MQMITRKQYKMHLDKNLKILFDKKKSKTELKTKPKIISNVIFSNFEKRTTHFSCSYANHKMKSLGQCSQVHN